MNPTDLAPAVYAGRQQGIGSIPDFDLYTLTAPVSGHPEGSTVSAQTLLAAGYRLPLSPQRVRQRVKDSFNPWSSPVTE